MQHDNEDRLSGALILAAILAALVLMLHHPTSFKGPDDGLLLADWSNTVVHGAMMGCLFLLRFAFGNWARRLGLEHASAQAGALAFDSGMTAFIAAALVSGFVAGGLLAQANDPDTVRVSLKTLSALNRALANLGMVLTVAAMALCAIRMLRMSVLTRIAGALGLAIAAVAVSWLLVGRGAFGLYPATIATVMFGVWSILVASQMMSAQSKGDRPMSETHRATAIVPCRDLKTSEAFYGRLGFRVVSDHGHYLILADGNGWHLHLTAATWPGGIEDNPSGLYLYADDVDAVADRVRELILSPGTPERKPWGTYEFALSDPDGALVRIGRADG